MATNSTTTPINVNNIAAYADQDVVLESVAKPGLFLAPAGDINDFEGAVTVFRPITTAAELDAARVRVVGGAGVYELHHAGKPVGHHGWTGKFGAAGGRKQQVVAGLCGEADTISLHQGIDQFKLIDYWRVVDTRPYGAQTFSDAFIMTDRVGEPQDEAGRLASSFRVRLASEVSLPLASRLEAFAGQDVVLESVAKPGLFLAPAGDINDFEGAVTVFRPITTAAELDAARVRVVGGAGVYELQHAGKPVGHHGWTGKFGAAGGRHQQVVPGLCGDPETISLHQGIDQFKLIDYWRVVDSRPYGAQTFSDAFIMTDRVGEPQDQAGRLASSFRVRLAAEVTVEARYELDAGAGGRPDDANCNPWHDSGIAVREGAQLQITVAGAASFYPGGGPVGPAGVNGDIVNRLDTSLPSLAVIGKIGATGTPFTIGEACTVMATQAGTLFVGYNDSYALDNVGTFSVTVSG